MDKPIALIDLGDTLCDCTPELEKALGSLSVDGNGNPYAESPRYSEASRRRIMEAPGFWRSLPTNALGFRLINVLRKAGFNLHILTKGPKEAPHVWAEKVSWCREHLPGVPVTVTDDKSLTYGQVLVDDWGPYVTAWQKRWPASLAILPAQPWNAQAKIRERQIRYDGTNEEDLLAALCRYRN